MGKIGVFVFECNVFKKLYYFERKITEIDLQITYFLHKTKQTAYKSGILQTHDRVRGSISYQNK